MLQSPAATAAAAAATTVSNRQQNSSNSTHLVVLRLRNVHQHLQAGTVAATEAVGSSKAKAKRQVPVLHCLYRQPSQKSCGSASGTLPSSRLHRCSHAASHDHARPSTLAAGLSTYTLFRMVAPSLVTVTSRPRLRLCRILSCR